MKYISLSGLKRALEQTVNYVKAQIKSNVTDKLGTASGIATLGTDGKLTSGQLPSIDKTYVGLGNVTNTAQIPLSQKGAVNGVATLGADGKVPSSQLPSYVDDVLEYTNKSSFPTTGETGKIYVDTSTNKTYRWSGTTYVEISASLALGETSSTAYAGDKGKALATQVSAVEAKIPASLYISSDGKPNNGERMMFEINSPDFSTHLTASIRKADEHYDGFMQSNQAVKLDGIAAGAQVNKIETITVNGGDCVSVSGKTVNIDLAKGPLPTDIRLSNGEFYLANNEQGSMYKTSVQFAAPDAAGFMSSTDKAKLTRIADGAQVNKIESVKVNGTALTVTDKAVNIDLSGYADSESVVNVEQRVADLDAKYAAIGNAYRVKGTKATIAEVTALTSKAIGDVWNVTAEFTLNEKKYPAGTNVVWTGSEWDALGGTVDIAAVEAKIPNNMKQRVYNDHISIDLERDGRYLYGVSLQEAMTGYAGIMSGSQASKLSGIAAGAQVNKIEKITIDGMEVTITEKTVDIPMLNGSVPKDIRFKESDGKFYTYNDMQTYMFPLSIGLASETAHGFMSSADKSKLDGIVAATDEEIDTIFAESIA